MKKSKKDIVSQREKTREKSAREEMLDERKSSPRRDRPRGGETPIKKTESENEEDFLEEKRRNPQDKSHLAYHDERFRCRKCARNASCFAVHKATQRMITIGKKTSLTTRTRNKNNNNSDKGRLRGQRAKRRDFEEAGFGGASSSSSSWSREDEEEEEEEEEKEGLTTTEKTTVTL